MKMFKEPTWQFEIAGEEGNTILFGVNIFNFEWIDTSKKAIVYDPIYNQQCRLPIYEIEIKGVKHQFAAKEFSNCVWGFYTFKY